MKVKAKKRMGQHFLKDKNTAARIAGSLSGNTRNILEVGPGMGALTEFLLQRTDIVTYAVEVDPAAVAYLQTHYPNLTPRLTSADFLTLDIEKTFPQPIAIIGNFPYNISSQIFFKILHCRNHVPEIVGMLQKEVAERIASAPGNKAYGILSVLLQAFYHIEYLFTVDENVFSPPPKVKSGVIKLIRNGTEKLNCDETLFQRIVKSTFNQRRKTIRNSLKGLTGNQHLPPHKLLDKRPEQLSVADFVTLTQLVEFRV